MTGLLSQDAAVHQHSVVHGGTTHDLGSGQSYRGASVIWVAPHHSPYHDAIHGCCALAHPFCRYTTVQLLLEKRCHHVVIECWPLLLLGSLLPRTSENAQKAKFAEFLFHALR